MTMRRSHPITKINPTVLFLILAVLIGGYIRLSQVLQSPFPLNDGGLFYTMTRDLMANNYRLPETTNYNHLNLPFAYSPLPFYFTGFLAELTGWNLLDIFRVLPALFTVLAIPAFFVLAKDFIEDDFQTIIATFIFTMTPASFDWLIMGGGLTRSSAFFLALLSLHSIYRLYTQNHFRNILWTSILAALTVLSHPEIALHTSASALVFFAFFGRDKSGLIKSITVAGLTIILTAPWWGTVLTYHGLTPFLAAGQTGWYGIGSIIQLFRFDLTDEYGLQTIGALGLIGLFWHLAERRYFIPVWLFVIFFSEPRSAPLYVTPCIAILASYSLMNILRIFNKRGLKPGEYSSELHPFSSTASKAVFGVLLGQWMFSALAITMILVNTSTLTNADKTAFDWVVLNTPPQSRFLILTGDPPLSDPTSEWFPALTDRTSVATAQGYEWDGSHVFDDILLRSRNVQYCINQNPSCIEDWAAEYKTDFDYIYIRRLTSRMGVEFESYDSALQGLLVASDDSKLVYETTEVAILKLNK